MLLSVGAKVPKRNTMTSNGLRRQHNDPITQFRTGQHAAPGVARQQPQNVITSSSAATVKVDVPQVVWIEDNIVVDENYIFFRANPDKWLRHEHVRHKVKSTSPGGVDGAVRWYVDKSYPVARPDFGVDKMCTNPAATSWWRGHSQSN